MGEGAMSVEARGALMRGPRGRGGSRAGTSSGGLVAPLRQVFGVLEPPVKNRDFGIKFVQFREYFLKGFSETKNSRKQGTGIVASC